MRKILVKSFSILIALLLFFCIVYKIEAKENEIIYRVENPSELCFDVVNGKLQIGVHSFYNQNDTMITSNTDDCTNTQYYVNNISGKTKGQDYPTWTFIGRTKANKHYIENIDVTNMDKYQYFFVSNRFQSYDDNTNRIKQDSTLKAGESIFIDINLENKNIRTNDYKDLRVTIKNGILSSDIFITRYNSISYYIIGNDNHKYGPYKLDKTQFIRNIDYYSSTSKTNINVYQLVSENLINKSLPTNLIIKKIRIYPYENYPTQEGLFRIFSISLDGYNSTYQEGKEYVTTTSQNVRQNITNNMATNGTIKWGVTNDRSLKFYCGGCGGGPKTFDSSNVYYGIPYVNNIDATTYSFLSKTVDDNGVNKYKFATEYFKKEISSSGNEVEGATPNPLYVYENGSGKGDRRTQELENYDYVANKNKESEYFLGQDCSSSTFYSIAKELPYVDDVALSSRYLFTSYVRILDNIEINYKDIEKNLRNNSSVSSTEKIDQSKLKSYYSAYIKSKYSAEEINNGYALTLPGDIIAVDGHVRLVTGYPHVECNDGTTTNNYVANFCQNHGNINPTNSYVIISEVRGTHINMTANSTEMSTHVSQSDSGWTMTPDSRYTDVTNVDSFYQSGNTNIVSFRFNKKYSFEDLYGADSGNNSAFDEDTGIVLEEEPAMYLPFRYKTLDLVTETNKIEKPVVDFILDSEYTNKELFNAKLYHYLVDDHKLHGILSTNYVIDIIKITINNQKYYLYPNQTNKYSLYYDITDSSILNALNQLNYETNNSISISVLMGPNSESVRRTLDLDDEGFIKVIEISTPNGKVEPTLSSKETITLEKENVTIVAYTYDGDGELTCTSSNTDIVTCEMNTANHTIKLNSKAAGNATVSLNASEGEYFSSSIYTIDVAVNNSQTVIVDDTGINISKMPIILGIICLVLGLGFVYRVQKGTKTN